MRIRVNGCERRVRARDLEGLLAMTFGRRGGWGAGFGGGPGWGGPGWSGGWDGGDGPRGRRRRQFDSAELRLILLRLIADQPRHGYDLIRAIEERSGGEYAPSPGVVYPTLTMLGDMGLISEQPGEGNRKVFEATAEGRAHLDDKAGEVEALLGRLDDMGGRQRSPGGAPIARAVSNLLSALWHRVTRDEVDEATLHEIAAILDEAAQKVERLKRG